MSNVNGLLSIARVSFSEAEAIIFSELERAELVSFWLAAQGSPIPQLAEARELIEAKLQTFGYLNHHDVRVWFIRLDESYEIFVDSQLNDRLLQSVNIMCLEEVHVKNVQGWTHLRASTYNELQIVACSIEIWSSSQRMSDQQTKHERLSDL